MQLIDGDRKDHIQIKKKKEEEEEEGHAKLWQGGSERSKGDAYST